MPKKKSSKISKVAAEEAIAAEPAKPSSMPKKPGSEINDIFAGKKRKKPEKKPIDKETENETEKSKSVKKKRKADRENEVGRFTDPSARPRKKTEDGYTIYTEEELGINSSKDGDTPLCPFDCDCCF